MEEHLVNTQQVGGSNPSTPTTAGPALPASEVSEALPGYRRDALSQAAWGLLVLLAWQARLVATEAQLRQVALRRHSSQAASRLGPPAVVVLWVLLPVVGVVLWWEERARSRRSGRLVGHSANRG